jgi:hypothetical protein
MTDALRNALRIRLREVAVNLEQVSFSSAVTITDSDRLENAAKSIREVEKTIREAK